MVTEKNKCDPELGIKVRDHLRSLGLLNMHKEHNDLTYEQKSKIIEDSVYKMLDAVGMNMQDPNLLETPKRVRKYMLNEQYSGLDWSNFPKMMTVPADKDSIAAAASDSKVPNIVIVKNLRLVSLCAHHLAVFLGIKPQGNDVVLGPGCTIAYIPNKKLLGLSKFQRGVDHLCNFPNNQETLTKQICAMFQYILETEDVAVYLDNITHTCCAIRGASSPSFNTSTLACGGQFLNNPEIRQEFLAMARKG